MLLASDFESNIRSLDESRWMQPLMLKRIRKQKSVKYLIIACRSIFTLNILFLFASNTWVTAAGVEDVSRIAITPEYIDDKLVLNAVEADGELLVLPTRPVHYCFARLEHDFFLVLNEFKPIFLKAFLFLHNGSLIQLDAYFA